MLELLLVIVILMALAAIVWPNIGNRTSDSRLEFAARQLASLLQLARSQAMNTGNTFRCRFERDGLRAVLEEETDPFKQSGVFEVLKAQWATLDLGADNLKCVAIQFDPWETQLREQEAKVLEKETEDDQELLSPPIVFNPDGTSDSVAVLLGNAQGRNFTLTLNGLTGQIRIDAGDMRKNPDNETQSPGGEQDTSGRRSDEAKS